MKNTETEETLHVDSELEATLAEMADDVPPMPADFRSRWMSAVREEAGRNTHAAEEASSRSPVSLARWTRILSVAAVFVFLIGGTVLYRNARRSLDAAAPAGNRKAVLSAAELPAAAEKEEPDAPESEEAYEEDAFAEEKAALFAAAEEEPVLAGGNFALESAAGSVWAENASFDAALPPAAEEAAYADDAEKAEEAAEAETAAEASKAVKSTAMPTDIPTAAPEILPEAAPEETAGEDGFLREAGAFFSDMGDFLLAALPFLLVLAVPAAAALVIRFRKRR